MNKQPRSPRKDLIVLVADKDAEAGVRELLGRHSALGIRTIMADVFVHPHHDPGVFNEAHEFLSPFISQYAYALVMFDLEGSGRKEDAEKLAIELQSRLDNVGWSNRSMVVVLNPELEIWVWSDSPHVAEALGLSSHELAGLLAEYRPIGQKKPSHPKEAVEQALRRSKTPRSSSIYSKIARGISLSRCTDSAFLHLKANLQEWFPSQ